MALSAPAQAQQSSECIFVCALLEWLCVKDSEFMNSLNVEQGQSAFVSALHLLGSRYGIQFPFSSEETANQTLSNNDMPQTIETLATLFEETLGSDSAKKRGAFYTPPALADSILQRGLAVCDFDQVATILDPACGSGIFLIRLVRLTPAKKLAQLPELLRAVDINRLALAVARLLTAAALFEECKGSTVYTIWKSLESCFHHGNFLIRESEVKELSPSNTTPLLPLSATLQIRSPALVIGNPPYGLSRGNQIDPAENAILLQKYAWARRGKVNKYLLFLAEAFACMETGDVLSFVVPNAWLGIQAGKTLRELFLESGSILSIHSFKQRPFEKASVEVVSLLVKKNAEKQEFNVQIFDRVDCQEPLQQSRVTVDTCQKLLGSRLPLCWISGADDVLRNVLQDTIPLSDRRSGFRPAIALQAYARGKGSPPQTAAIVKAHSFHHDTAIDDTCIPYLEGRDVERYGISWSGSFLAYGPWLAEPQSLKRFSGPRIILREVTGNYPKLLVATYTEEAFLYNKSCLHILPTNSNATKNRFLALLGILNSSLASFCIKLCGNKTQRMLFPKIVNADLLSFPIPKALSNAAAEPLASLATERLYCSEPAVGESLEHRIDEAVFELYKLPKKYHSLVRENRFPY